MLGTRAALKQALEQAGSISPNSWARRELLIFGEYLKRTLDILARICKRLANLTRHSFL